MPIKIKKKIRTIFMGTPDFSLPALQSLIASQDFEIIGVFTQIDKKIGRQQILTPPPVKRLALENKIPVFQPLKLKTEISTIQKLEPDLIVVVAYGKIIPQEILDIPRWGGINLHASLLPKYRGAACLSAPLLNGDRKTGISIMKIEASLDTGPILRQAKIELKGNETLENVHDSLSLLGAQILIPTLKDYLLSKLRPQKQDEAKASYVKMTTKEDGSINWKKSALEIERMIRAYNPWPGTYSKIPKTKKILKIIKAENKILISNKHQIGEIFLDDKKLAIQSGKNALIVLELQEAGKKIMATKNFLSGHQNMIGTILE